MKTRLFHIAIVLLMATSISAQQVNTLYFLESAPMRHTINPAFQPVSWMYIGITPLSLTSFNMTNSLAISDLVYKRNGQAVTALHPNETAQYNKILKRGIGTEMDAELAIFNFGIRIKENGYLYVGINEKVQMDAGLDARFLNFLCNADGSQTLDLSNTGLTLYAMTEIMGGYSHKINEQWTVGGKLKFLYGNAYAAMTQQSMKMQVSPEAWHAQMDGNLLVSGAFFKKLPNGSSFDNLSSNSGFVDSDNIGNFFKPAGFGGSVDLGATYKPHEQVRIALSVTDLGFIHWTGDNYSIKGDETYCGKDYNYSEFTRVDGKAIGDTLVGFFKDFYTKATKINGDPSASGYTRMLNAKLNFGVDANFLDDRLGVGIYSRTSFYNHKAYEEVTLGLAYRPVKCVNLAATYSFVNSNWNSIGFGLNLIPYDGVSLTIATDYIPFTYCDWDQISKAEKATQVVMPYKVRGLNVAVGFNIVIGTMENKKKDSDHDGVPDYRDMCPLTPRDVKVDNLGCPIDNDGDGVPDYKDLCPNTPHAAYGLIDTVGCPIDSDGDGVPDYLDECPNTPEEAYGYVDAKGCYLDSDGDGVPDYKDHCPGTPREAQGYVDENGCPIDSDMDGVPDYKDLCPNTPRAAYGFVDATGCPIDSDGDGVPDYLDECPDTPEAARGFVDQKGCLLDTDGDEVPDYLDECPTVAGPKYNKGCPEIQKEVKTLLQKAMQGIQFENGKATIKKQSFALLNQIAVQFIANPTFRVEVQGHTDNVGNATFNKELSEKRAQAVRTFLVNAGVNPDQLTAKGYGDEMPIADNNTKAGRAKNRRVEFVVTFEQISYETVLDHVDSTLLREHLDSIQPIQMDSTATQK